MHQPRKRRNAFGRFKHGLSQKRNQSVVEYYRAGGANGTNRTHGPNGTDRANRTDGTNRANRTDGTNWANRADWTSRTLIGRRATV